MVSYFYPNKSTATPNLVCGTIIIIYCYTVSNNMCYFKLFDSNGVINEYDHYTEGMLSQMKSFNFSLKIVLIDVFLICFGRKFHNFGPM